jgi:hypothetical protein
LAGPVEVFLKVPAVSVQKMARDADTPGIAAFRSRLGCRLASSHSGFPLMPDIDEIARLQKRVRRLESHVGRLNVFAFLVLIESALWLIYFNNPRLGGELVVLVIIGSFGIGLVSLPFLLLIWLHGMTVPEPEEQSSESRQR